MRRKKLIPKKKTLNREEIEKEKESVTCYECKKFGHIKSGYPLLKKEIKKKKKAFVVTWSDSGESSSKEELHESANLCSMAHENEVHSDSSFDFSIEELHDAFNDLMDEYKKLSKKIKESKPLNQVLNKQLETLTKEKVCVVKKNQNLKIENVELEESNKDLIKKNEFLKN